MKQWQNLASNPPPNSTETCALSKSDWKGRQRTLNVLEELKAVYWLSSTMASELGTSKALPWVLTVMRVGDAERWGWDRAMKSKPRPCPWKHPLQSLKSFPRKRFTLDSKVLGARGEGTAPPRDGGFVNVFPVRRMNKAVLVPPKHRTLFRSIGCSAARVPELPLASRVR